MKHNLADMMCLDLYLSSLSEEQKKDIDLNIPESNAKIMPLLSWDIYSQNFYNEAERLKKENDIEEFTALAKKLNWQNDIESIFKDQAFDALVITNLEKQIVWVNNGFSDMTGYTKKHAINKTPAFLQGAETSAETKKRIREKILQNVPFTDVIINYKKDNTPYKCEIKIIPLYNSETTHFLALEREVG